MTTVNVSDRPAHDLKADALVLAHGRRRRLGRPGRRPRAAPRAPPPTSPRSSPRCTPRAAADEVLTIAAVPGVAAPRVVLTGLGKGTRRTTSFDHEVLRRAAGAAVPLAQERRQGRRRAARPRCRVRGRRRRGRRARRLPVCRGARPAGGSQGQGQGQAPGGHRRHLRRQRQGRQGRRHPRRACSPTPRPTPATWSTLPPNQLFPQSFADSVKARNTRGHGQGHHQGARREGAREGRLRRHRRRRPGLGQPAAHRHPDLVPAAGQGLGRAGRQGHHLRLRRPATSSRRPACSR